MPATRRDFDIPSGLTLEKLWEYLYASNEKWETRFEREKAEADKRKAEIDQRMKENAEQLKITERITRETAKLVKAPW